MNFDARLNSRIALGLLLILALLLSSCGTTRPPQTTESLLEHREQYAQSYLDQTNERYTEVLRRTKAQLDEYRAGRASAPPTIDYLVISGGGDFGAFGAGFLKGWSTVPKSHPLARPRFDVVTGVSTGALIAPFAWLDDPVYDQRIVNIYRNPRKDWVKERWPLFFLPYPHLLRRGAWARAGAEGKCHQRDDLPHREPRRRWADPLRQYDQSR